MRLVSPLLKHVVYPGLAKAGYLRLSAGPGPTVVTYHGVLPAGYDVIDPDLDGSLVPAESFRRQLWLLKSKYNVISPRQFLLWCEGKQELPSRSVLLTCDDGLRNTLTDMLPILQELALSCLFFVTGASLSNEPSMLWYEELYLMFLAAPENFSFDVAGTPVHGCAASQADKRVLWQALVVSLSRHEASSRRALLEQVRIQLRLSEDWKSEYAGDPTHRRRFFMLSVAELRELSAARMVIGEHTQSHPMLSQLPAKLAWDEIVECRRGLEQALGEEIWALAYPFGNSLSVTGREMEMAERAGFKCAFLNVDGGVDAETSRFALPRVHITADMSLSEFEAHVSGFYGSLRKRLFGDTAAIVAG
jgi:peptidoglycan/xylan/chitin deacetylase (PgdA/CDA1 family)